MNKKRTSYFIIFGILGIVVIYFLLTGIKYIMPYNLTEGQYSTSVVDRGPVMTYAEAEGVVEPENEVLLLSPATSVIEQIVNEAGSRVKAGEVILQLDPKPVQENIENIREDLEMKRNNLDKNRLNARNTRLELDYNVEMKKLRIASIKSELEDQEQLLEVGGISNAKIEKTRQELVMAQKDLEMILQKNSIRLKQLEVEEEGLMLQIQSQERRLAEQQALLQRMLVKAPSDGIVLNVHGKEGEKVNEDKLLVRMSDLSTFKITGYIDENLADIIKTGGQVYAIVDQTRIPGQIGTIRPLIEDNKIQFDVFLQQSNNPKLISNLRVPLQVVKAKKDSVLRVQNGPAFGDEKNQQVFVIRDKQAVRKQVQTGLIGQEYVEINEGLETGEKVITSDISSFRLMKEVEIENE